MTDVLEVELLDDSRDTWVLGMSGEWDMYTGGMIVTELFEQTLLQRRHVILELSKLTFVDSTALSRIIDLAKATTENGRALVLSGPTPAVRRLLTVTGLEGHLPTAETLEEALALVDEARKDDESTGVVS